MQAPDREPDATLNGNAFWFEPELMLAKINKDGILKGTHTLIIVDNTLYNNCFTESSRLFERYQELYRTHLVEKYLLGEQ